MKKWVIALAAAGILSALIACSQAAEPASAEQTEVSAQTEEVKDAAESAAQAESGASGSREGENSAEAAAGTSITVTDMTGREVTLEKPAERIVALTAADCEILSALGAGDLLVGRGEYCDYPAEVLEVPAVQSGSETNIEQILALEPQIIFMADMEQSEEQIRQLEQAGVRVAVSDAHDIEGTYTAIEMIGTLTGKSEEAASLIEGMKAAFSGLKAKAFPEGGTVYFEVSPLEYGLWTAGNGTFMNEVAELMGLSNCFADVDGWAQISEEQVLLRNPDYIVTISMYYGEGLTPEEEILSRPGWEGVTAVKNGAVLNLQNNELSRPAPRLADGARMLYDFAAEHRKE